MRFFFQMGSQAANLIFSEDFALSAANYRENDGGPLQNERGPHLLACSTDSRPFNKGRESWRGPGNSTWVPVDGETDHNESIPAANDNLQSSTKKKKEPWQAGQRHGI